LRYVTRILGVVGQFTVEGSFERLQRLVEDRRVLRWFEVRPGSLVGSTVGRVLPQIQAEYLEAGRRQGAKRILGVRAWPHDFAVAGHACEEIDPVRQRRSRRRHGFAALDRGVSEAKEPGVVREGGDREVIPRLAERQPSLLQPRRASVSSWLWDAYLLTQPRMSASTMTGSIDP
jgi:hypothetical protein